MWTADTKASLCSSAKIVRVDGTCQINLNECYCYWHNELLFLQIKDTIGYDTLGHCFFTEDGIEQRNTLFHNLGLVTKPGTLLPTDRNSSMCVGIRDKVYGSYIPVPATDCMWVFHGEKVKPNQQQQLNLWWSLGNIWMGTLLCIIY